MKTRAVKFISLLLTCLLVTGSMSIIAYALDDTCPGGSFGTGLTWEFDNGTLTVSGTGEMPEIMMTQKVAELFDAEPVENNVIPPWAEYCDETEHIVIGESITSIAAYSFAALFSLKTVVLPSTLKSIGDCAFVYDTELAQVNLPEGLESLGSYAFMYCLSIQSLTLPSSLTDCGSYPFDGTYGIRELTVSEGFSCTELLKNIYAPSLRTFTNYSTDSVFSSFQAFPSAETADLYTTVLSVELKAELYLGFSDGEFTDEAFMTYVMNELNEVLGTSYSDIEELENEVISIYGTTEPDEYAAGDFVSIYCVENSAQHEFLSHHFIHHCLTGSEELHESCFSDNVDHISYASAKTYTERMNGYYSGSDSCRYFRYYVYPEYGDVLTLYYKDGTQKEYVRDSYLADGYNNTGYIAEDGEIIPSEDFSFSDNQSYYSQWTAGSDNYWTFRYLNKTCRVPVVIQPNPVSSVSYVSEKVYTEHSGGSWCGSAESEYYNYNVRPVPGDVLTVNYSNGSSKVFTYVNGYIESLGYSTECFISEDGERLSSSDITYYAEFYNTPWTVGSDNYWILDYMGATCSVRATVQPNPVDSIEFFSEKVYNEGTGGYWQTNNSDLFFYYYYGPDEGDVLKVNYSDGTSKAFTFSYRTDEETGFGQCGFVSETGEIINEYSVNSDQFNEHWAPGKENILTVSYMGREVTVQVVIQPGPVESVSYSSQRTYLEKDNGNIFWISGRECYFYNFDSPVEGDRLTVNYTDGTSKEFIYGYHYIKEQDNGGTFFWCGDEYITAAECCFLSDQYDNPWTVGGENRWFFGYLGKCCEVPAVITEEPVASFTFVSQRIYNENENGCSAWGPCGDYYHYECNFVDGDVITVAYKDGTSKTFVYGSCVNQESGTEIRCFRAEDGETVDAVCFESQYGSPWIPGGNNSYEVRIRSVSCTVPVTVWPAHTHDFTDTSVKNARTLYSEASCTNNAGYYYTCTVCGKMSQNYYMVEGTGGHTGGTATCGTKAVCTRCGEEYGEFDFDNHTGGTELRGGFASTCTENGKKDDTYCLGCGRRLSEGEIIPAAHTLAQVTANSAACTTDGNNAYWKCGVCGACFKDAEGSQPTTAEAEIIPAAHTLTDCEGKAATCTENGWKPYKKCVNCDYSTYEEIVSSGHKNAEPVKENEKAATCRAEGSYEEVVYCNVCGAEISRTAKTVVKKQHTYEMRTVPPTCTSDGAKIFTCSACGDTYSEVLSKTGHSDSDADGRCDVCGADLGTTQPECGHLCHKTGFLGVIWRMINLFNRLFRINQTCECGAKHW